MSVTVSNSLFSMVYQTMLNFIILSSFFPLYCSQYTQLRRNRNGAQDFTLLNLKLNILKAV